MNMTLMLVLSKVKIIPKELIVIYLVINRVHIITIVLIIIWKLNMLLYMYISAENNIEIIHTSLAKEVKEDRNHNLKSVKCLNGTNKSNFDEKIDISSIENNNDSDVNDRKNPNFVHTNDQIITNENDLQITDEGPHMVDSVNDREKPNFVHTDDQIVTSENDLQITDDEGPHMVDVNADRACDKLLL